MWLDRLLEMKKASGLTTKEVFENSNVPIGTLNKLFAGQTLDPKLETIKAVVYSMGYTLNDLFPEDFGKQISTFKTEEQEYIKKYRRLDDYGKETVNLITDRELARVESATDEAQPLPRTAQADAQQYGYLNLKTTESGLPLAPDRPNSNQRVASPIILPTPEDTDDKK